MTTPYRLSFTTGGLFVPEAPVVVACYFTHRDWQKTRDQVRQDKLLQVRTDAAATRISKELVARLELLTEAELQALQELNLRDRAYLLWVAACRRYQLIHDFAIDVLREHHLLRRRQVTLSDYDSFYNSKALWHPELDALAQSTQSKLRQNLFRMLREADLLSTQHLIQPALPSPYLAQLLAHQGPEQLLVFPATDMDIQRWLT